MNRRRSILTGARPFFHKRSFGQKSCPDVATGPVPFGYKMAWIAVKAEELTDVVTYLKLQNSRPASWSRGIELAYERNAKVVFVAPPIEGWVLIVGWSVASDAEPVKSFYNTTEKMSSLFSEVQAFASHRVVEYHLWMLARHGHVVRSFAYVGDRGELLDNKGTLTETEQKLVFFKEPQERLHPNEKDVMRVAGGWSIDPSKLTSESGPAELGVFGRIGFKIE